MNTSAPGDYYVRRVERGTVAVCCFRCPFCSLEYDSRLPTREVTDRPRFLVNECPRCGVKETYAPRTKP